MDIEVDLNEWKILLNVPDCKLFNISTSLDLPNQRVIASDVDRTRAGILSDEEKIQTELLLTHYCKEYNTCYKQGMNEIMAPFVLMTRKGLPLHMSYQFFKSFVHTYLATMFVDHTFRPLQAMFLLFRLLLRYHEPRMSSFFLANNISPELFVTSWFLTVFACKVPNVSLLYSFWQEILIEKEVLFPLFVGIAFLQQFKLSIMTNMDFTIPHMISQIFIDSPEIMKEIINKSRRIKEKMPYSMLMQICKYDIYNLDTIDLILKSLEKQACLTVLSREILHRAYPDANLCNCKMQKCPWCSERWNAPLVLVDCRTQDEQSAGIFPNSVLLKTQAYEDTEFMLEFPDQFIPMRGIFHFCLMGSLPTAGVDFNLSIKENEEEADFVQNMVENLLQAFLVKGFPYLSTLEGGFERCHEIATHYKIDLEGHVKSRCNVCSPNRIMLGKKARRSSVGEKLKSFNSSEMLFASSPKLRKNDRELTDANELELTGCETASFFCKLWSNEKPSNNDFKMRINHLWFIAEELKDDNWNEYVKCEMQKLSNITILRKNSLILSFRFKDFDGVMFFLMKSAEDSKRCVGQVSKCYQLSIDNLRE